MKFLSLFAIGFVGTLFWPANPEAATVLCVAEKLLPLPVAGLATTLGQTMALTLLYFFGGGLRRRWKRFDHLCTRAREKHGKYLDRGWLPLALSSGVVGLPPVSISAALAPGLGIRLRSMLPVLFLARFVRFTVLAGIIGSTVARIAR